MKTTSHLIIAGMLASATALPAANIIVNGSFETTTATPGSWTGNVNELGGNPLLMDGTPGGISANVAGWESTTSSRTWLLQNQGGADEANFPDGDYAVLMDGDSNFATQVLAQSGLSMVAGTTYTLTFDLWGRNTVGGAPANTQNLNVRFAYDWGD